MAQFSVALSHKILERLDARMKAQKLNNYAEVLSAAINYPRDTFQQVGEPVYDGQGCIVRLSFDDWREADFEVSAQRQKFRNVIQWFESILTD